MFAKAQAGERQIVFVTGPVGIGKTALVETFLDSAAVRAAAAPVWIARGCCVEQHGAREAYMPVLDALEHLAHRPDAKRLGPLLHDYTDGTPLFVMQRRQPEKVDFISDFRQFTGNLPDSRRGLRQCWYR